jgi:hypothetical protein
VNTTSNAFVKAATSSAMTPTSSGMTTMRRTSTPSARSSRQRYAAFSSRVLPDRISLPMRMMPAVFGMTRGNITTPSERMLDCGP